MKALVYTGPYELIWRDQEKPPAIPGETLVRIEAAGICGSDMHAYHGRDNRRVPPLILGHEAAGIADGGPLSGRRVVVNPLITCGACAACSEGRSNLCEDRNLIGMVRPGAFAEWVRVPDRNLIPLPDGMDPVHAALTEPTATAAHALGLANRALHQPLTEADVLVLGAGSIGLIASLLLRRAGARRVEIADTNSLRRDTARATGALHVRDPVERPIDSSAYELIVDAVGSCATRDAACRGVRSGGVIVHIGLQDNEGGVDVRKLTLAEVTFVGSYTYTVADLRAAVNVLHDGLPGGFAWIDRRPLREGHAAFGDLDAGKTAAAKVVLVPAPQ